MTGDLNLGAVFRAIAAQVPERPAVLHADLLDTSSRLARHLNDRGIGSCVDRSTLHGHGVGQHLLAQYLHNGPGVASLPHGRGHNLPGTRLQVANAHPGVNANLLSSVEVPSNTHVVSGVPCEIRRRH